MFYKQKKGVDYKYLFALQVIPFFKNVNMHIRVFLERHLCTPLGINSYDFRAVGALLWQKCKNSEKN